MLWSMVILELVLTKNQEALLNGTLHTNSIERQKDFINSKKQITVEYSLTPDKIEIIITDEGNGFDHKKVLARTIDEEFNGTLSNGRGIALSKKFLDSDCIQRKGKLCSHN